MNSTLLTCTNTDGGSSVGVGNRIGLGIFERQSCDDEIYDGLLRKIFVGGNNFGEQ